MRLTIAEPTLNWLGHIFESGGSEAYGMTIAGISHFGAKAAMRKGLIDRVPISAVYSTSKLTSLGECVGQIGQAYRKAWRTSSPGRFYSLRERQEYTSRVAQPFLQAAHDVIQQFHRPKPPSQPPSQEPFWVNIYEERAFGDVYQYAGAYLAKTREASVDAALEHLTHNPVHLVQRIKVIPKVPA